MTMAACLVFFVLRAYFNEEIPQIFVISVLKIAYKLDLLNCGLTCGNV